MYPFEFELLATYKLSGRSLSNEFRVINKSGKKMNFAIGGHPAFNCPLFEGEAFEDYEIIFNKKETIGTNIIDLDDGGSVSDALEPFLVDSDRFTLDYGLMRKYETLVFSSLKSNVATLRSRKTGAGVTVDFSGFEYFGVWTPPGAPFICLEPWQGIDAKPFVKGQLRDKTGYVELAPNSEHSCCFTITPNGAE